MLFVLKLLVFILGLSIGSFLNVVIYRLENNKSFLKGRSYCPHCKHKLTWIDLVPVFSFLILHGKCRYCGKKISIQYPLVEIITALIFLIILNSQIPWMPAGRLPVGLMSNASDFIELCFMFYVSCSMIVVFVYDLKHFIIPDNVLFPAIIITFFYRLVESFNLNNGSFLLDWESGIGNYIIAALIASGFFLAIFLVSEGKWIGFGDVKLAILLGLILGLPKIVLSLFLAFFFGAIIGIGLIVLDKKGLKSEIPFGPFLITGFFVAVLFGDKIIRWYLNFLQ